MKKTSYIDQHAQASRFEPGDTVRIGIETRGNMYTPFYGRVLAVLDSIGMVDVITPHGVERLQPHILVKYQSDSSHLEDTLDTDPDSLTYDQAKSLEPEGYSYASPTSEESDRESSVKTALNEQKLHDQSVKEVKKFLEDQSNWLDYLGAGTYSYDVSKKREFMRDFNNFHEYRQVPRRDKATYDIKEYVRNNFEEVFEEARSRQMSSSTSRVAFRHVDRNLGPMLEEGRKLREACDSEMDLYNKMTDRFHDWHSDDSIKKATRILFAEDMPAKVRKTKEILESELPSARFSLTTDERVPSSEYDDPEPYTEWKLKVGGETYFYDERRHFWETATWGERDYVPMDKLKKHIIDSKPSKE